MVVRVTALRRLVFPTEAPEVLTSCDRALGPPRAPFVSRSCVAQIACARFELAQDAEIVASARRTRCEPSMSRFG